MTAASTRRVELLWPALAITLCAAACSDPSPVADTTPAERFDALWQDFDATYPFFTLKAVDWDAARATHRPRAATARTDAELAAVLVEMLGPLRDLHVVLVDPGGTRRPTYVPSAFRNHDAAAWSIYAARYGVVAEGNWGHGMIGAVPYLYVQAWNAPLAGFDAAMEQFKDAPAIVIDVRMNGGGNSQYAEAVVERFTDQARIGGYVRYRNGPGHDDFTAPQAGTFSPGGPWQFTRPVLLLIGAGAVSSTEDFVSAMRELPHVTLAGDTTGGATANPAVRPLGGGWSYTVSTWLFTTPDGIVVQDHGIPPHVAVAATAGDLAMGVDPVLDFAERWAANPAVLRTP